MEITRRAFLAGGSAAAATTVIGGAQGGDGSALMSRFAARPRLAWAAGRSQPMPAPSPEQHLLSRATWGPTAEERERIRAIGLDAWIEEQLAPESIDDSACQTAVASLETLAFSAEQLRANPQKKPARAELIAGTLFRMTSSRRQLYEVMVDHWSSHFNVYHIEELIATVKTLDDREVIRKNAMGSFRAMLHASAQSPAMMRYLDTLRNTKAGPNENYAREVMELHTLGAAVNGVPYTEQDVKEVARCFTGWSLDNNNAWVYLFRPENHDDGHKTVLGRPIQSTGTAEGHEVLDRLVDHPACAPHVARRMVRRLVSDNPPESLVAKVAAAFGRDGDIRAMLGVLLRSAEFKAAISDGGRGPAKLRRPLEYWAAAMRALGGNTQFLLKVTGDTYVGEHGASSEYDDRAERYLELMDHVPFRWRTPDGYPDLGPRWRGMHMLVGRWNYALALCEERLDGLTFDFYRQQVGAGVGNSPAAIVDYWTERLLGRALLPADREILIDYLGRGSREGLPSATVRQRLPMFVALVLDSPYFQRR